MSTTHVQSLPNVRGRMSYTEFGEGKRRRAHLENGTDRIASQMGDAASREDFIVYCEGQRHRHPNAVNEGYELRISWATDELDPSKADDIQRGMEYAYTLCHELAPDSMCWVTMHVDGEGGCVHAHATIANHDARTGQVINKGDTSLYAPRVKAVNDELSRACGFQVLGADKEQSSADFALDVYDLDRAYVSEMASDLQKAHIHRSREEGKSFMDERYEALVEARNRPDEQLARLREDVDAARREFYASKEARDTLQHPCPGLLAGMYVFAKAGCNAKDPVSRMMADMTAMMLRMMIQEALAEEARRQREEAERRVYESRKNMWDAEKRLKAAEKALSDEDERETKAHAKTMQARYARARSASPSAPRSADKDTQFGE